jgi:hypothetical protein
VSDKLVCGKILGHLADGVTPITCFLNAGHDVGWERGVEILGRVSVIHQPASPHVARVEVAP